MTFTGKIEGLHVTPRSFLPMRNMEKLQLVEGLGIEGDRHSMNEAFHSDRPEEGRQITFFEVETLEALKRDHDIVLRPEQHRRNVTTRGVPLNHLVGRRFRVGECVVEATRLTTPCRHIEQITGLEIYEVLLHRAGLNAKIIKGGHIHLGDVIEPE